jgi:hypothetical protein
MQTSNTRECQRTDVNIKQEFLGKPYDACFILNVSKCYGEAYRNYKLIIALGLI